MRHTKYFAAVAIIFSLAGRLSGGVGRERELGRPVAIDRASDSELYVLSGDGTVRKLRITGNRLEEYGGFPIQGFPIDFTYSVSEQVASLFVCSTLSGKSVISRYSTDGVLMKRWWLWHTCGGIDFDYVDHAVYIATTDTNEIYRLDILKDSQPKSIGELRVPGEAKLGPIAVDTTRKLIYASDLSLGIVYEFDPVKRVTRVIATDLGLAASLYFDSSNGLLYVADSTAKRILSVSPNPAGPSLKRQTTKSGPAKAKVTNTNIVIQNGPLANPSGVVPAGPGQLAVSDFFANKVFIVSLSGQVISQYPP